MWYNLALYMKVITNKYMKVGLYGLEFMSRKWSSFKKESEFSVNNFWALCRLKSFELQHEDSITC